MIKFEDYPIHSASLGRLNPMPDIKNVSYIHADYEITPAVTDEEKRRIGKGMINTLLPYKLQDGYDRVKKERIFKAAVIENDRLRAVFLPELGGRLWSLYDKELGRELLYVNTVFQPGNLGLRNAWFSGGVEFNVGIKGHNPLTCSPLFCEVAETPDGEVISFYEYERIRGVVYTVSAWLPEGSPVLYIRGRVENTSDEEKYMYWWSNIAVPETPDTRVIVPADDSFLCFYSADHYILDKTAVPYSRGTDVSYPSNLSISQDFFYKVREGSAKWIAAAEADGRGLLQCSTDRLLGRKLFLWGQGAGGRNWNEFLSERGQAYIEIQAGLAYTQLEHIRMPAKCEWEWVEAYTALDCPPDKLRSADWGEAVGTVEKYIAERVGDPRTLYFPPESGVISRRIVYGGSGWGVLENRIREIPVSRYHVFSEDKNDAETRVWHALLDTGALPERDPLDEPESYVVGAFWREKLERAEPKNWYTYLQLGVVRYADGNVKAAEEAWRRSLELETSPWALRNIAMLYKNEYRDIAESEKYILRAVALPGCGRVLYTECAAILTASGSDEKWLVIYDGLSPELKAHGRLRLYRAIALMHLDRLEEAAEIINGDFVMCDIKEGELAVSKIWFELYRRLTEKRYGVSGTEAEALAARLYPLPRALDFRMH